MNNLNGQLNLLHYALQMHVASTFASNLNFICFVQESAMYGVDQQIATHVIKGKIRLLLLVRKNFFRSVWHFFELPYQNKDIYFA